jgi:hypothetical protein
VRAYRILALYSLCGMLEVDLRHGKGNYYEPRMFNVAHIWICAGYYTCLWAGDNSRCHRNRENPPSLTENNIRIDYKDMFDPSKFPSDVSLSGSLS